MKPIKNVLTWLEHSGAAPAYAGWVLIGLTLCFWVAAANTMAGWLYVLSGLGIALLLLAAAMPMRTLKGIKVTRFSTAAVHEGEPLWMVLNLFNLTSYPKGLLIAQDQLPQALGEPVQTVVEVIAPQDTYSWRYQVWPQRRGLHHWQTVTLRTGAPLGLFWSRKVYSVRAELWVYPRVLSLLRCPILDQVGSSPQQPQQVPLAQLGNEGTTRSLRPYRWGDPTRMVHWRSSARFSELRVRELEVLRGGYTCVIALNTQCCWHPDQFEQAVMAAASLFCYAMQHHGTAQLWTPQSGFVQDQQRVLELLAQVEPQPSATEMPPQPVLWLTTCATEIEQLPLGSRYILWTQPCSEMTAELPLTQNGRNSKHLGFSVAPDLPLQVQLQILGTV